MSGVTQGRRPIIGGNWKMNTDLTEARSLAGVLVECVPASEAVEVVIFPPFTNLLAVQSVLGAASILLGAQDVFWERQGAFTGEISAAMLRSVGVEWVIAGHSERRHILGESSETVNRKLQAALGGGLKVILAAGETDYERLEGRTEEVLEDQLSRSLAGVDHSDLHRLVIAYEPVWAIGTGLTASPEQAQAAHAFIRAWISGHFGASSALELRIQYGGSVTSANAADLLAMPDIDGALVGGASLKAADFAAIVDAQRALVATC